jgi:hypothetical protein
MPASSEGGPPEARGVLRGDRFLCKVEPAPKAPLVVQCSKNGAEELNLESEGLWLSAGKRYCVASQGKVARPVREKPYTTGLSPGDFVRHPGRPDWGLGQIQTLIGPRITVNFENAGKVLIDGTVIELEPAEPPRP